MTRRDGCGLTGCVASVTMPAVTSTHSTLTDRAAQSSRAVVGASSEIVVIIGLVLGLLSPGAAA
jgi:hypothetical protein